MIHKEGYPTIALALLISGILIFLVNFFSLNILIRGGVYLFCLVLMVIVLQFFRNPARKTAINDNHILAPADGKVVVIEEVEETEYFKDRRLQVSVFMSPINVHVNRYPIFGTVKYVKYHKGLYLVAWHPKSSTENERTTIVVEHASGQSILFRQIAGALARRIVYYCKEGDRAVQGGEFGFIKFGSRVDLFLPLSAKVKVELNDVVRGGESVIASFDTV